MVSESPNEKKADRSIVSRIFYFIIGCGGGAYFLFAYYPRTVLDDLTPIVFGLIVLGFGLTGLFARRVIFEIFRNL